MCSLRRKSRDAVLRGLHVAALPPRFPESGHPSMPLAPHLKNCGFPSPDRSPTWWPLPFVRQLVPNVSVTDDIASERPSHEVLVPTAHEASKSDCHSIRPFPFVSATRRDCLSRLRYVFRLSQPLDVLFLSMPFRPYFVPVTLMGFRLRRFPLAGSCTAVSSPNRFDVSSSAGPSSGLPLVFQPPVPVQGFWHPASPLPRPALTGHPRPVPPLAFFSPRVSPSAMACASEPRR